MKAACFLASSLFVIFSLSSLGKSVGTFPTCFDDSVNVTSIPKSHLYHKKPQPLVIGHHGNPSEYQENTVDGFKSLVDLKADGMEFDTFLTKDQELVVIHYDNTMVSFRLHVAKCIWRLYNINSLFLLWDDDKYINCAPHRKH